MPSFSLKWMLAGVAAVALGCVALLNASPVWATVSSSAAVLLLLAAPIFAIYRNGHHRAFWVGFTLFGWGYFAILSLAAAEAFPPGRLFTSAVTAYVYEHIPKDEVRTARRARGVTRTEISYTPNAALLTNSTSPAASPAQRTS